jgi:hypothetical protein
MNASHSFFCRVAAGSCIQTHSAFFIYGEALNQRMYQMIANKFVIFMFLSTLSASFFCAGTASSVSEYDEIQVVKSDQEGIIFKYFVPQPIFRKVKIEGIDFDQIQIDKCVSSDLPGEPQLPVRIVVIGVPPEAEIQVEILESPSQEQPGVNLTPALKVEESDKSRLGYKLSLQELNQSFMLDRFFPEKIASLDAPIFLRNQRIVRLKIYPVQYNAPRKIIRYYSQLTISVRFLGGRKEPQRVEKDLWEKIYQNVLLNYEESKSWRKKVERERIFKPGVTYPFDYSKNWYKIVVRENGIYKIDRSMLLQAGVPVSEIDPKTFRIFTGGGKTLSLNHPDSFLELKEVSIFISGEDDGSFDSDDFILFYGWSVNDWDYDLAGRQATFYTNPFTYDHIFWLTFGEEIFSKRMEIKDGSLVEQNPFTPLKFKARVHEEHDKEHEEDDYRYWYWEQTDAVRRELSLPGAVPEDTNFVKVKTTSVDSVDIRVNQKPAQIINSLSSYTLRIASTSAFHGGIVDTLDFFFSDTAFLDYYEVEYWRRFECYDKQLFFESPGYQGVVQYEISNLLSSQVWVFDITDKFEVKMIKGVEIVGEQAKFQDTVQVDSKTRYYLVEQSRLKKPVELFLDQGSNLRNVDNQADFLIIAHSDFYDQVQRLKSWRSLFNQIEVKTVKVQDIYDEFSGGLFDPVAIQDFLRYAYQKWQPPAPGYVLLVGDGNYDYKNNLGTGVQNFIPPFTPDPTISDDMYVLAGDTLSMIISRLPVRSANEAEIVLDKIIEYEKEPEFGTWRNLITLVADDEWAKEEGSIVIDGLWEFHTNDSERLAKYHVPSSFDISKVYLMEYPFDYKGEKPQAEEAIVNSFNSGSLIINYIGHANPDLWAHEYVFRTAQDIPKLNNDRKLPLVYMASCRLGLFFSPYSQGMAEELLRAEGKGAIATISAVMRVTPTYNAELNFKVYDLLLYNSFSIGEALFAAKISRLNSPAEDNDREYALFGDPLMKLGRPSLEVSLTQVTSDTFSALSLVKIEGEIKEREDNLKTDFNGKAYILGFDSQRKNVHEIATQSQYVSYNLPGLVIFRGEALVEGGRFSASFVVPKDISYGGNTGRISVYVFNENQDGGGAKDSLVILGSDTTVVDTLGPEITVSFEENPDFLEGDVIPPSATLQLSIFDEHGINITGEVGHGITLAIDQDYQHELDLTEEFQYDLGSFQRGSVSYQLSNLSSGGHLLNIKAWDNANNSSLVSVGVEVRLQSEFELTEVMNYPNPFSKETSFYYRLASSADRVKIEVFTLAGRLIRTITNASGKAGINFSTTWDAKDQDGDEVANGVYIYKVVAEKKIDGEERKKEVFGKAVVLR